MDEKEKDQLIKRLNIVVQQRNSFLDQIVVLQEQLETALNKIEDLETKLPKEDIEKSSKPDGK